MNVHWYLVYNSLHNHRVTSVANMIELEGKNSLLGMNLVHKTDQQQLIQGTARQEAMQDRRLAHKLENCRIRKLSCRSRQICKVVRIHVTNYDQHKQLNSVFCHYNYITSFTYVSLFVKPTIIIIMHAVWATLLTSFRNGKCR